MRFLVLVTDAFGGRGGIAQFNRDLLSALCDLPGCEEVIAIPRLMPSAPEMLPKKLRYVVNGIHGKLLYITATIKALFGQRQISLIICGHINLLPVAFFAKIFLRVPVVLIIYGIDAWEPKRNMLVRYFLRHITAVLSISEYTKSRFLSWAPVAENKILLLPNAIDLSRYGSAPKNAVLEQKYGLCGRKVIMTMGRISASEKYKGFDEIIDLLPELSVDVPDVVYMIVGDGDDLIRLKEKVRLLGLTDRTIFTGFIPESEKADHYRLADVYVMPSRGEGFGFVFLEALACGIPVVASTLDGSREAVRDGALGILVDPSDPLSVKQGILNGLRDEKREVRDGLSYFSFENFRERLSTILSGVISIPGGSS